MPIINRKNSNKHNFVYTPIAGTSAQGFLLIEHPWNTSVGQNTYTIEQLMNNAGGLYPLFTLKDINNNEVKYILDNRTITEHAEFTVYNGETLPYISLGVGDLDLSDEADLQNFIYRFINIINDKTVKLQTSIYTTSQSLNFDNINTSSNGYTANLLLNTTHNFVVNNSAPDQGTFVIPQIDQDNYFIINTPQSLGNQIPTVITTVPLLSVKNYNDTSNYEILNIEGYPFEYGISLEENKSYYFWKSTVSNSDVWFLNTLSFPTTISLQGSNIALNLTASSSQITSKKILIDHDNDNLGTVSNNHILFNDFDTETDNTIDLLLETFQNITIENSDGSGTDETTNISFDYLQPEYKSGSITLDPKIKSRFIKNYINLPQKRVIDKFENNTLNVQFDDNNTIIYSDKTLNLNTRIEINDQLNNLLISSPNEFDLSVFTQNKIITPRFTDEYLSDNFLKQYDNDYFDENTTFYENKFNDLEENEEIEINLNFNIPCILSNNRTGSPDESTYQTIDKYESSQDLIFPVKVENSSIEEAIKVKRHTSPTAYYNFSENRWDYLGNIKTPTYLEAAESFNSYISNLPASVEGFDTTIDNVEGFTELGTIDEKIDKFLNRNAICFSSATNDYSQNIFRLEKAQENGQEISYPSERDLINKFYGSIGSPIQNFGFPFSEKFEPLNGHKINLSKYIHKDFYLKSVVYDGTFTSYVPGKAVFEYEKTSVQDLVVGYEYVIYVVGNTDFTLIGAEASEEGVIFTATDQGIGDGIVFPITQNGGRRIGINNVSFFLMNNRKNLNEEYFSNIEDQQIKSLTWDQDLTTLKVSDFPIGESEGGLEFKTKDNTGTIRKFSYFTEADSNTGKKTIDNILTDQYVFGAHVLEGNQTASMLSEQRDLITYSNIVNFCSGSLNENSLYFCLDYEKAKSDADYFNELSPYHDESFNLIENEKDNSSSFYKKNIQIYSKVKSATKQDQFAIYSFFPTLLSNKHGTRTNYSYNSGRSNKHEIYSTSIDNSYRSSLIFNPTMTFNGNNTISIESTNYNASKVQDEYILKPNDEITLGVSLTNSFNNKSNANGNLGDDVFIVHNLKVKLIGSYKRKENTINFGNIKNKTIDIKRSIIGDNDLVDESYTSPVQLTENYFTRIYEGNGIGSSYINDNQIIEVMIKDFISVESESGDIYDTSMNNILDVVSIDGKKKIDDDWPNWSDFSSSSRTLNGWLYHVPYLKENPNSYENNIWVNSYPFEEKYINLERPKTIEYSKLGLKGFFDDFSDQFTSPVRTSSLSSNDSNKLNIYFYSYYSKNDNLTRLPVTGSNTFIADGFKLGILHPIRQGNKIHFSNKKYGNYSDKINSHVSYVTINNDGDVNYTVIKKFFKDYIPVFDISSLENTYNKNSYAQITKPFIDKDLNSLSESNSIP